MSKAYDESTIKNLSSVDHIRLRTEMYIGRTGDGTQYEDGIYVLLKEVVDNAVDEFIMKFGKRIEVEVDYDSGRASVRDYGRGIPLGKIVECVSQINTGAKYNDDVFQFSVGLNGVGTKAVNALSTEFTVRSHRDGEFAEAHFACGKLVRQSKGKTQERNGTFVSFVPDASIFQRYKFRPEPIERRMEMYAYLNAGLTLRFNGVEFKSENGLLDLVEDKTELAKLYKPFHYRDRALELAFTHTNNFNEDYYSFVNGQYTHDGGTHLSAFREGLLKAVNEYSKKKKYDSDDLHDGIVGAVAVRLKDPKFEGQTKSRLGNTDIRSELVAEVRRVVEELFHREPAEADKLIAKIEETSTLRAELSAVKKLARERAKSTSIRAPQLKDCKKHFNAQKNAGLDTMLFIVEGVSAGTSFTSCRDVANQAVFTLRGKPLNVCDLKRDTIYKNVEIYNLISCLNIEKSVETLRYNKIVLATDADVDGLHIRNLMITLFLRFYERVVKDGHLFILETPLFRVRNKRETHYCYTDPEREAALAKCGATAEITRFKGLGEISPSEFKPFIGQNIRLTPVDISRDHGLSETIAFYMGRNTPERRQYIMDNLEITEDVVQ